MNSNPRPRVLVVEDESEIRQLIVLHLKREEFDVEEIADGEQARAKLQAGHYDLVILDWMLPSLSGLELIRWLRRPGQAERLPVLFVTAKAHPEQVAMALDCGADDYVTKPFDTLVLMARVNALLRRHFWIREQSGQKSGRRLAMGNLVLDGETFEAKISGQKLDLTRSEFHLLQLLMENQGKVLSRKAIVEQIQGENIHVVGRTVDTHVFGLRKKLGEYADFIETIRGVGYRVRHIDAHNR